MALVCGVSLLAPLGAGEAWAQGAGAPRAIDRCAELKALSKSRTDAAALMELGDCYEQQGKTASAWVTMREAASVAKLEGAPTTEADARVKVARLEASLPRLTVEVASAAPGMQVLRNGAPIGWELFGIPFPIDPGTVEIDARAPGKVPWKTTVMVPAAKVSLSVQVPELAQAAGPGVGPTLPEPEIAPTELPSNAGAPPGPARKIVAAVMGAAGIIGIAGGAVFGVRTLSLWDDAKAQCPAGDNHCTAKGIALGEDAMLSGNISTIAFAAGGGLLLGGIVLWVTAPTAPSPVAIHSSGTSISLRGRFR
ncbi:MAG: hypothetical protein WKG00_07355 [Polyangiaceae bacterium]